MCVYMCVCTCTYMYICKNALPKSLAPHNAHTRIFGLMHKRTSQAIPQPHTNIYTKRMYTYTPTVTHIHTYKRTHP